MDKITVNVPVTVKAKLTEKLKARLIDDFDKTVEQMELEIKQVELDRQHELNENPEHIAEINQFFGNEIAKRQQHREESLARKENIQKLPLGAEIVQGTLERTAELKIGGDIRELMNVEVLVEDDKIIAIRG